MKSQLDDIIGNFQEITSSILINESCLASSTILKECLTNKGYEVEYFTCELHGYSKNFIEWYESKVESGEEPQPKNKEEAEGLSARGIKILSVYANMPENSERVLSKIDKEKMLQGHVCIVVKKDNKCFFIDPTAKQFTRTVKANNWTLNPGTYILSEFDSLLFNRVKELNSLHKAKANTMIDNEPIDYSVELVCGGVLSYSFKILNTITSLNKKKKSKAWRNSDLNPEKYSQVIKKLG